MNNQKLQSWVNIAPDSDFSIYNLPFGIFSTASKNKRIGIAIGNQVLDLAACGQMGAIAGFTIDPMVLNNSYLNDFIALGKATTNAVRLWVQSELCNPSSVLKSATALLEDMSNCQLHLPVNIGDYTDFYASKEHATNVGMMFRDPANALLPNWKHLPVGYHGRASSIVVSGTPIKRPSGQVMPKGAEKPVFQASSRLDFELEMGFIIGKNTNLGETIAVQNAEDHIFGLVLFNDWSARDIQAWEYVPLGPFLGKNFGSSMSPWVVTIEALELLKVDGPIQDPAVLPYLDYTGAKSYDINLQVAIKPHMAHEDVVANSNFKYMYWNMAQQLAHHTVNGCNVRIGDLMGSGTISGPTAAEYGSMLELAWSGSKPITLSNGETRSFINDHDTVILKGFGIKDGIRIGFGQVSGEILPS